MADSAVGCFCRKVYDIAFKPQGTDEFASVGADGSLRLFDLRNLEHSSIVFEDSSGPLLRLAWNRLDPNYIAVCPFFIFLFFIFVNILLMYLRINADDEVGCFWRRVYC